MTFLRSAFAASLMLMAMSCDYNRQGKETAHQEQEEQQQPPKPATADFKPDTWDKKIIKNGTLNIEVENYQQYNKTIHELTTKWEAYISAEQENTSDYKIENTLTIKIPAQYFDEAVQQLSAQPGKLLVKQINAQDVTAEYFDTKTRMEAKKRIRLCYLDMLNKAKNMEEVLQVEREINNIQEQVEAGEGRINYLSHSAAYGTI